MGLKANGARLALVSLALALATFVLASRVGAAPLPATTVSTRPFASAGANGRVTAIARAGDRVYIGGSFTSVGGQPRSGLAALDAATGQLVASWRTVMALAAGAGRVYAGGDFTSVGGVTQAHIARFGLPSASARTRIDVPGPTLDGRGADRFADPRVATLPYPS